VGAEVKRAIINQTDGKPESATLVNPLTPFAT